MKYLKIDSKGNIITGTTVILIASLILILIFVLTSIYTLENENTDSIAMIISNILLMIIIEI